MLFLVMIYFSHSPIACRMMGIYGAGFSEKMVPRHGRML